MNSQFKDILSEDIETTNPHTVYPCYKMDKTQHRVIEEITDNSQKAVSFSKEINENIIGDFENTDTDKMCHVSTFCYKNGNIYVSYYANTMNDGENPDYQVARLAYAPENNPKQKTIINIMAVGDNLLNHKVKKVYDTILMEKDDEPENIYILWTAFVDLQYYRLCRIFNTKNGKLGEVMVNRFKVCDTVNDFSTSGMKNALAVNGKGYKEMFADIGIMQKLTSRIENGTKYYYTGAYSGYFTCIIKSTDLITWEYVAQPDEGNGAFRNNSQWENAVYVLNDKAYYFVRQQWREKINDNGESVIADGYNYGILTYFDLKTNTWCKPVLVGDCQSRSDFIYYNGNLFLFHAPTDRSHIGIVKIDTDNLENSSVLLQADINGSCFYPFVNYDSTGKNLCMSYTVDRKHIRLSRFTLSKYL